MYRPNSPGSVIGTPSLFDADHDGIPDLITSFQVNAQFWVEAVSGRSGSSLWRFDLPIPSPLHTTTSPSYPAQVIHLGDSPRILLARGSASPPRPLLTPPRLATRLPRPSPAHPSYTISTATTPPTPSSSSNPPPAPVSSPSPSLSALNSVSPPASQFARPGYPRSRPAPDWPLALDLDSDSASDVLVPLSTTSGLIHSSSLQALSGPTGKPLWTHRLRTPHDPAQVNRLIAGPDLNADGHPELFAALIAKALERPARTRPLHRRPLRPRRPPPLVVERGTSWQGDSVGPLRWWNPGPTAGPAPRLSPGVAQQARRVLSLSAATGQLVKELPDAFDPIPDDFDGDGLLDLGYSTSEIGNTRLGQSLFHVLPGRPPAVWSRLGHFDPVPDLNRDGLDDLIEPGSRDLTAISGRTGQILWVSEPYALDNRLSSWVLVPSPFVNSPDFPHSPADFDADGTPDLLLGQGNSASQSDIPTHSIPIPLLIHSGRTGRLLWSAGSIPNPGHVTTPILVQPTSATFLDLNADGLLDVATIVHIQRMFAPSSRPPLPPRLLRSRRLRPLPYRPLLHPRSPILQPPTHARRTPLRNRPPQRRLHPRLRRRRTHHNLRPVLQREPPRLLRT